MDQNGFTLAENRTALASIRIPAEDLSNPASPVLTAAKELRYYLGRITAASIPVLAADDPEGPAKAISLGAASGLDVSSCSEDGFVIEADSDSVKIGGGKRGVLYGAYDLLERLGCRFFTPLCEKVPTDPCLSIPPICAKEEPVFEFRRHNYADIEQYPRFAAKRRFNGAGRIPERLGGNLTYAMHVHTFDQLVPARVYGKDHPEYFAEVNGQRVTTVSANSGGWQTVGKKSVTVSLQQGRNVIRLSNASNWMPDIDYIELTPIVANTIHETEKDKSAQSGSFDLQGRTATATTRGFVIKNGEKHFVNRPSHATL